MVGGDDYSGWAVGVIPPAPPLPRYLADAEAGHVRTERRIPHEEDNGRPAQRHLGIEAGTTRFEFSRKWTLIIACEVNAATGIRYPEVRPPQPRFVEELV